MPGRNVEASIRRLRILQLLPRRDEGSIPIQEIQRRLEEWDIEATVRTLQRDMELLSAEFPIAADETGRRNDWFWTGTSLIEVPSMGRGLALAFQFARGLLPPLLPPAVFERLEQHFARADQVLSERPQGPENRWQSRIRVMPRGLERRAAEVDPVILDRIYMAVFERISLDVEYWSMSSGVFRQWEISPLGIVYRSSVIELVAWSGHHGKIIRLPIHRMRRAEWSDASYHEPPGFDLDSEEIDHLFAFPASGEWIELQLWTEDPWIIRQLEEVPLVEEQHLEHSEAGALLSARIRWTVELEWWLLGRGAGIEVVGPAPLRERMHETVRRMLERYAGPEDGGLQAQTPGSCPDPHPDAI